MGAEKQTQEKCEYEIKGEFGNTLKHEVNLGGEAFSYIAVLVCLPGMP